MMALALALIASWYAWHPGEAAAGPALRHHGWRGEAVAVCRAPFAPLLARCIVVRLTDYCGCLRGRQDERAIDLSRHDFARLADPDQGLVRVVIFTERGAA